MWESIRWLVPTIQVPTWANVLTMLIALLVGGLMIRVVIRPAVMKLAWLLEKRQHPVLSDITKNIYPSARNALIFSLLLVGISVLVETWLFDVPRLKNYLDSIYIYFAFKALYDVLTFYLVNPERFETGKDQDILTPFFLRISKVAVMIIAMFTIASMWDFNLNGFLTAIGLTGVALAFGIRDTLSHIFAGMSVVLDKPFQIGDWIMTADEKIDGVVEDINLRSTLIKTSDKGTIYVPNAYLTNRPIYNMSKREQRKVEHTIFVSSNNREEHITNFVETVREQIALHPKTLKDIIHVAMDEWRPSSCRIFIRYFVATNDTGVMMQTRQDILFAMKHACEDNQIELVDAEQAQFVWND